MQKGFIAAAIVCLGLAPSHAQTWPSRTVTIVVPFAPGGALDLVARAAGRALSAEFGQAFVIDNRPGAGGNIATASVAKAAPDGYTLLQTGIGPGVLNPLVMPSVPYDMDRDFTPVGMLGEVPQVIVSNPALKLKGLADLVELARNKQGAMTIGHAGAGSTGHLAAALLLRRAGIKATFVSYRGAAPLVTDIRGGQIDSGIPIYIGAVDTVTSLAVTSAERVPFLANVPTAQESGVDLVASTWMGLVAPAGTPADVIERLNRALNAYLSSEAGRSELAKFGVRAIHGPPNLVSKTIAEDRATWAPVVEAEKLKPKP